MEQILIHCGSYKTGTSSIQNFLHHHRDALIEHSILYPRAGMVTKSPEIGYRHSRFLYKRSHKNLLFHRLRSEIARQNMQKVIFSSEIISDEKYQSTFDQWLEILRIFSKESDNIKGVLYLRNRNEYMRSYYREFVRRHGHTEPFADFIGARMQVFDYPRLIKRLNRDFHSKVDFHVYENVGNTCQHFVENYVHPVCYEGDFPRANQSTNAVEAEIHRQLNILQQNQKVSGSLRKQIVANHPFNEISKDYSETFNDALSHTPDIFWQELNDLDIFGDKELSTLLTPAKNALPVEKLSSEIQDYCLSHFSGRRQKLVLGWRREFGQPQWAAK